MNASGNPAPPILKVESLVKKFRDRAVLRGLDFSVGPGEVLGFLGPNGAGKTTTVKIISGIIPATAGTVNIAGLKPAENHVECKRVTSVVPEQPHLWERLSGYEYLVFVGKLYGLPPPRIEDGARRLLADFELSDDAGRMIEVYSYGMRQKLAWCAALLTEPKLLILDEPFTGLDPAGVRTARAHVQSVAARGGAVFISTHILDIAEKLCGKICVIDRGKIAAQATRETLKSRFAGDLSLEDIFFEIVRERQPGL